MSFNIKIEQDYNHTSKENNTSLDTDPKINSTIKPNPYTSNVEIEKGEIVLSPDMKGLFKATGKRHSRGGTPVFLEPNSFECCGVAFFISIIINLKVNLMLLFYLPPNYSLSQIGILHQIVFP